MANCIGVGDMLGPPATDTDSAEELNLHFNSVKYRVLRAQERRGHPVTGDRLDVELALPMCHWLGAAVLGPEPR